MSRPLADCDAQPASREPEMTVRTVGEHAAHTRPLRCARVGLQNVGICLPTLRTPHLDHLRTQEPAPRLTLLRP